MLNNLVVVFFIIAISLFICWLLMQGGSHKEQPMSMSLEPSDNATYQQRINQDPMVLQHIPSSVGDLPMIRPPNLFVPNYLQMTKGGM
mgnify:CR=1 FL=1|tara:strand:+ start:3300 stop:3563 length:264 start_codon:yes stop_codon:yes gene_type:complete